MLAALSRCLSGLNLSAQARPINQEPPQRECTACTESKPDSQVYIAPCSHVYCTTCTTRMFQDSLRDESVYPPRCCQQDLALSSVSNVLGSAFVSRFMIRAIEVATFDRTYCHIATCSRFILPCDIVGNNAVCQPCFSATCTRCKEAAHRGDCTAASSAAMLALVEAQGWRDCPRCHAIIELAEGCNHITCRCNAEWCYLCGSRWKTCECPQYRGQRRANRPALGWDHVQMPRALQPDVPRAIAPQINVPPAIVPQANVIPAYVHPADVPPAYRLPPTAPPMNVPPRRILPPRAPPPRAPPPPAPLPIAQWPPLPPARAPPQTTLPPRAPPAIVPPPRAPPPRANPLTRAVRPNAPPPPRAVNVRPPQAYRAARGAASVHRTLCDHNRWRRVEGPHECDVCGNRLREFIELCRQCELQACRRCRRTAGRTVMRDV